MLGLDYSNARMRDPVTSMFLNEDPMSFAAGDPNLRRYVRNSATNATDPSGLVDPYMYTKTLNQQEFDPRLRQSKTKFTFIKTPDNSNDIMIGFHKETSYGNKYIVRISGGGLTWLPAKLAADNMDKFTSHESTLKFFNDNGRRTSFIPPSLRYLIDPWENDYGKPVSTGQEQTVIVSVGSLPTSSDPTKTSAQAMPAAKQMIYDLCEM